ncbi:MAG TPA: Wzz/FepE/Etk N-terminal domain-containing protein [Parvularculaceae bacterium]|nr:Wzz/FepE/Etk N-terminal domain-containing protein [Parvularculaceae bacterium]HNS85486.1 Wzz/FepE/Etk N-terminal domain-containing protein [Parvularculaceae bacterium]
MGFTDLLNVLQARRLIVLWSIVVGLGVGIILAAILPTKYVSRALVQVDSIQRNNLTGLVEPRLRVAEYLGQQAAVASSRTVALAVINQLSDEGLIVLSDYESRWRKETGGELVVGNDMRLWAADQLLRDLTIAANDIGSTLELSFRADDPAQAARIANAFAAAYMSTVLDQKQRRFARKAANFSDETEELAEDVAAAQNALADYRERSGILPMGSQKVEAAEIELAALTARLAEARADDAEAQSLLRQAEATPRNMLVNFPLPEDALPGRQAQVRLAAVAATLARIAERYGERYPDYIETAREKAALEANLLQSIRDRADYAARRVDALETQAAQMKATVTAMQKTRETYDLLEDRVETSQETYNLVTARSMQESLQSRVDTLDVFLLSRATPPADPATPPLWAIAFVGAFAGAAIGASFAVFIELMEGRIRSVEMVQRTLRTRLVCEVGQARRNRRRKFRLRFAA